MMETAPFARERAELLRTLEHEIGFGRPYFALATAACAIATLGLLENSAAVIIGAMLIKIVVACASPVRE
jgi:uncharacterized membrane protein